MASEAFKIRQSIRDSQSAASKRLTPEAIGATYKNLLGQHSGFLNDLSNQQALAGMMAGKSATNSLSRAGLGSTGLGAGLSSALSRGSAFQSAQVRSQAMTSLWQQALELQQMRAGVFMGGLGPLAQSAAAGGGKPWWQTGLEAAALYAAAPFTGGATLPAAGVKTAELAM